MTQKILILGTLPPPVGGVTIYCKRLLEYLNALNIPHYFVDFKSTQLINVFRLLLKYKFIHIHTSNSYFRLLVIVFARSRGKNVFFTFHGNIGRYGTLKNLCDQLSIKLASKVYVINKSSFKRAKKHNPNTHMASAFLQPLKTEALDTQLHQAIQEFLLPYKKVFCTNAFNVSFDKEKQEVYQITKIVQLFAKHPELALIFSDPTSNYIQFLKEKGMEIPQNVFVINQKHDFNEVLKLSNCLIRYTTTDGDSISVKEALSLGKQVIASDVVSRPKQVNLVSNLSELENEMMTMDTHRSISFNEDSFRGITKIYKEDIDASEQ